LNVYYKIISKHLVSGSWLAKVLELLASYGIQSRIPSTDNTSMDCMDPPGILAQTAHCTCTLVSDHRIFFPCNLNNSIKWYYDKICKLQGAVIPIGEEPGAWRNWKSYRKRNKINGSMASGQSVTKEAMRSAGISLISSLLSVRIQSFITDQRHAVNAFHRVMCYMT
jgi:hypothetical protein